MEDRNFGNLGKYAKESAHKEYVYSRLPENIRQIGETDGKLRIYIEDYVMTYIQQIFNEKQEKAIVVFLGKNGKEQAAGCVFIYGAVPVQCDMMEGPKELTADKWNQVYKDMHDNFPGAQMLGWGCGVSMWNSKADNSVRQIHEKYFSEDGKMLFVKDISEKEEKLFLWHNNGLVEQPGFVVYYEKNPQMQDYMLKGKGKRSNESAYKDNVTENMRNVIREKEDTRVVQTKHLGYAAVAVMFIMLLVAANLLYRSMDKIKSLEASVAAVEGYMDGDMAKAVMTDGVAIQEEDGEDKSGTGSTQKARKDTDSTSKDKTDNVADNTGSTDSGEVPDGTSPVPATKAPGGTAQRKKTSTKNNAKKAVTYNGKYESYIVNAGDTLSQIVWRQYHSFYYLDKVMKVNNIKNSDKIYKGECIILPEFGSE